MSALIVNLFGAPGAGKSTGAAYVFSKLKMLGYNCELVREYAKDLVWEENFRQLSNQIFVFAEQYRRLLVCKDKVDIIITDSPLLLSIYYDKGRNPSLPPLISDVFNSFDNCNFMIYRTKKYNPKGRIQSEEESKAVQKDLEKLLNSNNLYYFEVDGSEKGYEQIVDEIGKILK